MKTRLATLLVIAGGVIYGVTKNSFNAATSVIISLIGGFLLQVGTYQLDASVSSQLRIIKDSLLRNGSANS